MDPKVPEPPSRPLPAAPERVPGSVRRTSHIDMLWDLPADAEPFAPASLHLRARARDVRTGSDGGASQLAEASLDARVDPDGVLARLQVQPLSGDVRSLLGERVGPGFRRLAEAAFPGAAGTPVGLLLDDLPVAALIAGYARTRRAGAVGPPVPRRPIAAERADICSGWVAGGTMIRSILAGQGLPYRDGPEAPLPAPADAEGWHQEDELPLRAMRRRRRIDVLPEAPIRIDAMFRDTWMDPRGHEEVLHEYVVSATLDPCGKRLAAIAADPRALPFGECLGAAGFVSKLEGLEIDKLRRTVRQTLVGTQSCTHLNDLLRTLGDVPVLLQHVG